MRMKLLLMAADLQKLQTSNPVEIEAHIHFLKWLCGACSCGADFLVKLIIVPWFAMIVTLIVPSYLYTHVHTHTHTCAHAHIHS